jgi:hypothetical protein
LRRLEVEDLSLSSLVWQTRVTNEQGRLLGIVTQTQMVLEPRPTS